MTARALISLALFAVAGSVAASPILWYNGDADQRNSLANEGNGFQFSDARVYDDVNVTASSGWNIDAVFSNDLVDATFVTQSANYEIRQGVSIGNGGTLIASGSGLVSEVNTGISFFGRALHTFTISGLNIHLDPGTYWLMVRPVDSGSGDAFIVSTSGANAVGSPPGNNGNSFFDSTSTGTNFQPGENFGVRPLADFSLGVRGTVARVPEPGSLALIGLGFAGIAAARRRRSQ